MSLDGGTVWTRIKGNMPTQPVHDLKIHPRENDLIVATHGRGIFIADISALEQMTSAVFGEAAHLFDPDLKIRYSERSRFNSSSSNFNGKNEPNVINLQYYLKAKPQDEVKIQIYRGNMLVNELKGTANPGLNMVPWNMMLRRERTEAEKKAMQAGGGRGGRGGGRGGFGGGMGGDFGDLSDLPPEMLAQLRAQQDPNFISSAAPDGDYRIVLIVDTAQSIATARIMADPSK
jgi:hypothetical protein